MTKCRKESLNGFSGKFQMAAYLPLRQHSPWVVLWWWSGTSLVHLGIILLQFVFVFFVCSIARSEQKALIMGSVARLGGKNWEALGCEALESTGKHWEALHWEALGWETLGSTWKHWKVLGSTGLWRSAICCCWREWQTDGRVQLGAEFKMSSDQQSLPDIEISPPPFYTHTDGKLVFQQHC